MILWFHWLLHLIFIDFKRTIWINSYIIYIDSQIIKIGSTFPTMIITSFIIINFIRFWKIWVIILFVALIHQTNLLFNIFFVHSICSQLNLELFNLLLFCLYYLLLGLFNFYICICKWFASIFEVFLVSRLW